MTCDDDLHRGTNERVGSMSLDTANPMQCQYVQDHLSVLSWFRCILRNAHAKLSLAFEKITLHQLMLSLYFSRSFGSPSLVADRMAVKAAMGRQDFSLV